VPGAADRCLSRLQRRRMRCARRRDIRSGKIRVSTIRVVPNGVRITTTWMLRGDPSDDMLAGDQLPCICWGARSARIGIAASILEIVYAEARKRPGEKIFAVGLRIGKLSSISPDAHTFAFETLTRETP
jgi:hypothetical protein